MSRKIGFVIAAVIAVSGPLGTAILLNQPPKHILFKGADAPQRFIYLTTEKVQADNEADLRVEDLKVEKSKAYQTISHSARKPAARKPAEMRVECRLHALQLGGSPASPFVSICEPVGQ